MAKKAICSRIGHVEKGRTINQYVDCSNAAWNHPLLQLRQLAMRHDAFKKHQWAKPYNKDALYATLLEWLVHPGT